MSATERIELPNDDMKHGSITAENAPGRVYEAEGDISFGESVIVDSMFSEDVDATFVEEDFEQSGELYSEYVSTGLMDSELPERDPSAYNEARARRVAMIATRLRAKGIRVA